MIRNYQIAALRYRTPDGSATIVVLGLAIILAMWITGLAALVLPTYQKMSYTRRANQLRSACEASLDWINNNLVNEAASLAASKLVTNPAYDDASNDGYGPSHGTTTNVPSSVLPSGVTATVCVNNVAPPDPSGTGTDQGTNPLESASILYDSTITPPATPNANQWRMVTATATLGGQSKSITVILKPGSASVSAFSSAMSGRSNVSLTGNATTMSVNTAPGANYNMTPQATNGTISSTGTVSFSGSNNNVGGDVVVYAPTGTSSVSTSTMTVSGTATVAGNMQSYGMIQGGSTVNGSGSTPTGDPNYVAPDPASSYGNANVHQSYAGDLQTPTFPTTPTAPATATNLGALSVTKGTYTLPPAGATPNADGTYDVVVSSLSVSGNGGISITKPVNLYVQGSGATVSISGNGITNTTGQSSNFRIWYGGTSTVKMSGNANFMGVIYAPNTTVANKGNGTITGAIVGNYVSQNGNGTFYYDRALLSNPITIPSWYGFETVSWRELTSGQSW